MEHLREIDDFPNYGALLKVQETSPATYLTLLSMVQEQAEERLRKQAKIRLAFVISNISTWVGDDLCLRLMQEKRLEVSVVFVWQKNMDYARELALVQKHFEGTNIPLVIAGEQDCAGQYDVLFYLVPYLNMLDGHFDLKDVPLTSLLCYTGYGFFLANLEQWQFNLPLHNCCWRNYIHAESYRELAREYCGIGDRNMVFSGYPKLDPICRGGEPEPAETYWKCVGDPKTTRKILYAPHHSIVSEPYYSTFDRNFWLFLQYAKEHPETSWIIKPHPLLREGAVQSGLFADYAAFDAWMAQWDALPNARTMDGDYIDVFPTSDCMILDSVSFMAEYLYVHKPQLLLTREEAKSNAFGAEIQKVLYRTAGNDYEGILRFIEQTSLEDSMKDRREAFFERELDYYKINGKTAAEMIVKDLRDSLRKRWL